VGFFCGSCNARFVNEHIYEKADSVSKVGALVFVGLGSIFLKEFWEQAAASKKATSLKSDAGRPGMPGLQGSAPLTRPSPEPEESKKPADEKSAEEKPVEDKPALEKS